MYIEPFRKPGLSNMNIDQNEIIQNEDNVEWCRETGKLLLSQNSEDPEKRSLGLSLILKAFGRNDPEASYIVGALLLKGMLRSTEGNTEEHALSILRNAAMMGEPRARVLLNDYCDKRYSKLASSESAKADKHQNTSDNKTESELKSKTGRLVDFDGKPIKIDRKGVFTPIDAKLEYKDGVNTLTLSLNLSFYYTDKIPDKSLFERAVKDGIKEWQGRYTVFGGQELNVILHITRESRLFDNVFIVPFTGDIVNMTQSITNVLGTKARKEQMNSIVEHKRSFAVHGIKWSVRSRKIIYMQSENGRFDDYEELKNVAKHEFGHALGLGDLYESSIDRLEGVEQGTYFELDGYSVRDKLYNLVMCDHNGPISNNDIEMVVLAFSENRMQNYQKQNGKSKISKALGRGN